MHVPGNCPIIKFNSDQELNDCLKWWQDRLYLSDWTIHATLKDHVYIDDTEVAGSNFFEFSLMSSSIRISNAQADSSDTVTKVCQEVTLVHELLHLRMNWLKAPETYEGNYTDAMEHQNIEKFARSLIMAKYRIPISWFDNRGAQ